jgi:hypothetical protein
VPGLNEVLFGGLKSVEKATLQFTLEGATQPADLRRFPALPWMRRAEALALSDLGEPGPPPRKESYLAGP